MHPILIDLGFYALPSYGVMLAIAVLIGMFTIKRRADHAGMNGERLVDFSLWLIIWALVGAKGLLIIVEFPRYLAHPGELLGVVRAGGVFLGGFITALAAATILIRRYNLPAFKTFDVLAPSVALGHAIGRFGCLLAGCCWGGHCEQSWAITYTDPKAWELLGTPLNLPVHPFPIYAAIFNFILYLGLAAMFRMKPRSGRVFATYLAIYGVGRYLLEFTRGDEQRGAVFDGLLSTSQLIGILMVLTGVAIHLWVSLRKEA